MKGWREFDYEAHNERVNRDRKQKLLQFIEEICDPPQSSVLKQAVRDEPLAKEEGKGGHPGRVHVCVVSFRCRLLDPDNLCPKYFIDCLRYSEIIRDDNPQEITLEVRQEKVKSRKEERTEITVTPSLTPQ